MVVRFVNGHNFMSDDHAKMDVDGEIDDKMIPLLSGRRYHDSNGNIWD